MLVCDVCGHAGTEAEFRDDEVEAWVCPDCDADESAVLVVTDVEQAYRLGAVLERRRWTRPMREVWADADLLTASMVVTRVQAARTALAEARKEAAR